MERVYSIDSGACAITAATAMCAVGLITGAVVPVDIVEIVVGCDATTAGSLKVELCTYVTDGTGTGYIPKAQNTSARMVAAASTAKVNYTVIPTGTLVIIRTWDFPTPTGPFDLELPLAREISVPVSTNIYLRFTTVTIAPNGYATLVIAE
jgi:hypothetical protein